MEVTQTRIRYYADYSCSKHGDDRKHFKVLIMDFKDLIEDSIILKEFLKLIGHDIFVKCSVAKSEDSCTFDGFYYPKTCIVRFTFYRDTMGLFEWLRTKILCRKFCYKKKRKLLELGV